MVLDLIDIQILKFFSVEPSSPQILSTVSKVLRLSRSKTRLRLRKLSKCAFLKETKSYPSYYMVNPTIIKEIKEYNIPNLGIKY